MSSIKFFAEIIWEFPQFLLAAFFLIFKIPRFKKIKIIPFENSWLVVQFESLQSHGMSLGKIIFIHTPVKNREKWIQNIPDNPLIWHEFGHSLDSKRLGPLYIVAVGIPSLFSAWRNRTIEIHGKRVYTHTLKPYEMRANRLASKYLKEKYNSSWNQYATIFPRNQKDMTG